MNLEQTVKQMYDQGKKQLDEQNERRKKTDKELLAQITQSIDKAAETQRGQYQQNIDNAPQQFQKLYDANAVQEAVGRKAVEESMANMGLTDSGLNKSNQTVLAFQRGNADADARAKQMDYVTKMQNAIDTVLANAESKKATQAAGINKATSDWYTGALGSLASSAQKAGADAYAAEQKRKSDMEREVLKQNAITAREEARNRTKAYSDAVKNGMSNDRATFEAIFAHPTGDKATDDKAALYVGTLNQALKNGFDDAYATAAADAVVAGNDPMDGILAVAGREISDSGFNTSGLSKFYNGRQTKWTSKMSEQGGLPDWLTSQKDDIAEASKFWDTPIEWKPGLDKVIGKVTGAVDGAEISDIAKKAAIGKAVGETILPAVLQADDTVLNAAKDALLAEFGDGIEFYAAMDFWRNNGVEFPGVK